MIMRTFGIFFSVTIVFALLLLASCKKSHEAPVKPKLSFSEATQTVKESDGTIEITMKLDKAASEAISVTYELGATGSAVDKVAAGSNTDYDYEITSTYLECKIPKGELTGTISIKLYSDFN